MYARGSVLRDLPYKATFLWSIIFAFLTLKAKFMLAKIWTAMVGSSTQYSTRQGRLLYSP